ncbi:MAG TPA: cation:proton antiporter, partial [Polyangiaceae bacterium]|nr:cation:proton antiporter [Polyangiaceae bacterium]
TMAATSGKLALFLAGLVVVGLLVVPRGVRAVLRLQRPETTLVAAVGFCFAVSLLAHELGYSVALGAFIAGSLIAESGEHETIEHLVQPVRDMFAAIFFVSVGVLIDPALIAQHWLAVLVLTVVVIVGKIVGVGVGAFLTGNSVRTSLRSGMSLAQIGEFSFIIASLGLSLKATGEFLYPVAVAVSAITTLTTPWLIRASDPVANFVDRKMPRPIQTFVTLYATWLEQLRSGPRSNTRAADTRRLILWLALDAALLVGLAIGFSLALPRLSSYVEHRFGMGTRLVQGLRLGGALILTLPLSAAIVGVARRLAISIASAALPEPEEGSVDLSAAPRRAFVATLQIAIVLLTGVPILVVTQPVLGGAYGAFLLAVLLLWLGVSFWRGATNLHGHVQAGARALLEALMSQARQGPSDEPAPPGSERSQLEQLKTVLTGLGTPVAVKLDEQSRSVGKTLAQLNLRGVTGATVLAITRPGAGIVIPTAREVLHAGDLLALTGTNDAIGAAKLRLTAGGEADE